MKYLKAFVFLTLKRLVKSEKVKVLVTVVSDSFRPHGLQPTRLLCPWDSPGKNMAVGSHILLQGIFPTQGSNPGLLGCRQIFYHLSHQVLVLIWIFFFLKVNLVSHSLNSNPQSVFPFLCGIIIAGYYSEQRVGNPQFCVQVQTIPFGWAIYPTHPSDSYKVKC